MAHVLAESTELSQVCDALARRAKMASRILASCRGELKNDYLQRTARALERRQDEILAANAQDVMSAEEAGLTDALVDRLRLTPARIRAGAEALRQVASLPDPVGRVLDGSVRPNGLRVQKVAVPLGVIFFIYESRPNVTLDAAGLCVKSGNAVILRGGSEARHSNAILHQLIQEALNGAGLPVEAVQLVSTTDRAAIGILLKRNDLIDLVIPRGGEGLIRRVAAEATMPVMKHYKGNCHVYVDRSADLDMAERILLNAKCQRPGVCNAAESLLVHRDVAERFLTRIGASLKQQGVELRGCERTCRLIPGTTSATEEDYAAEFLDLILSIKVIESLDEALDHIDSYGSHHTDAIVTSDLEAARRFAEEIDSAAVIVNASTRFNDGFELGLGAEIGISTDKFHARGPCGLVELTGYKYLVYGTGQVRD